MPIVYCAYGVPATAMPHPDPQISLSGGLGAIFSIGLKGRHPQFGQQRSGTFYALNVWIDLQVMFLDTESGILPHGGEK